MQVTRVERVLSDETLARSRDVAVENNDNDNRNYRPQHQVTNQNMQLDTSPSKR